MSTGVLERFMEIVEATNLSKPQEEFVTAILSLLAVRLSRTSPAEREQTLRMIEEDGAFLRLAEMPPRICARDRIPAAYSQRDFVSAGGLMSYGTDIPTARRSRPGRPTLSAKRTVTA
jgi:hypothetical protein